MKNLKNVLLINAVSSGATGIGLVMFAQWIAKLFGTDGNQVFWGVGIFLVFFAALVFTESRNRGHNLKIVRLIIVLDVLWVFASSLIVLLQLFNLSVIGYLVIAAVAIWVAAMAYLQIHGVKNLTTVRA